GAGLPAPAAHRAGGGRAGAAPEGRARQAGARHRGGRRAREPGAPRAGRRRRHHAGGWRAPLMDAREAQRRTSDALDAGNAEAALGPLWALLGRSHMSDDELRAALALADKTYTALGRRRAVATLRMFRGDLVGAQSLVRDVPLDR